ncbi:MAG TPA: glycosyltransferase WbuB [Planctomycetes bacterium]|nr:glycosyltransferase WbuB [Planctomycetota bacterium]
MKAEKREKGSPFRKIRVGMVVHAYYEKDARVRRYAESLAKLGHYVEVVALRAKGLPKHEIIEGVHLVRAPLDRKRGGTLRYIFEYFVFLLLSFWHLAKQTFRKRFDVVHVHNMPDFLVFSALVPKIFGSKVVLDVHDLMPEVYASKFHCSLNHPMIIPLRIQEIASHLFADRVIFATSIFQHLAVARGTCEKKDSLVVLNAPDTDLFDECKHPWKGPENPQEFRLLYLGTVSDRHGPDQLIRVLAKAKDRIPGIRLVLHPKLADGEGEPLAALERLARELGVEDRLDIRPSIDLREVPKVMSRSSVGTFTPHMDVHIDIALSLKVPEYVAMGLPIVTVNTKIMRTLFQEGEVLYFEDGDIETFANHLVFLYEHPAEGQAMARRAKRFLNEHSWDQEFANYRLALESLCGCSLLQQPADSKGPSPSEEHSRTLQTSSQTKAEKASSR